MSEVAEPAQLVDEFRLPEAPETHSFWLVWRRNNPKNMHPRRRHPTKDSALREAARLSAKYPDSKIYVLEATAKFLNGAQVDYPVPNEGVAVK